MYFMCDNITSQISYASGLSTLSDRTRFKYYFRTLPNTFYFAPAILGVLNNFNWRRIAFITQNQNLFLQVFTVRYVSGFFKPLFNGQLDSFVLYLEVLVNFILIVLMLSFRLIDLA